MTEAFDFSVANLPRDLGAYTELDTAATPQELVELARDGVAVILDSASDRFVFTLDEFRENGMPDLSRLNSCILFGDGSYLVSGDLAEIYGETVDSPLDNDEISGNVNQMLAAQIYNLVEGSGNLTGDYLVRLIGFNRMVKNATFLAKQHKEMVVHADNSGCPKDKREAWYDSPRAFFPYILPTELATGRQKLVVTNQTSNLGNGSDQQSDANERLLWVAAEGEDTKQERLVVDTLIIHGFPPSFVLEAEAQIRKAIVNEGRPLEYETVLSLAAVIALTNYPRILQEKVNQHIKFVESNPDQIAAALVSLEYYAGVIAVEAPELISAVQAAIVRISEIAAQQQSSVPISIPATQ